MAILIANIGTSDLVVGIEGLDYFLPVSFERREPNLEQSVQKLSPEEREFWDRRNDYVASFLCDELGINTTKDNSGETTFSFREFSQSLLKKYNEAPEYWHDRIRPGRIWGVIQSAISISRLDKIIFLVTDQHPPNSKDTIYLYQILERWLSRSYPDLHENCIQAQIIPKSISAVNQDGLMQYFYQLFSRLDPTDLTLISIKGGTPAMVQALQAQAISSGFPRLVFVDPQLSVSDILRGNYSQCKLISYWRYTHTQKFLTIQTLLDRWDFDGAKQVCEQWEKTVEGLKELGVEDISEYAIDLKTSTKALEVGIAFLNLDSKHAVDLINQNKQSFSTLVNLKISYSPLLNLYTQCRICVDLNEISSFLIKVSSFYEGLVFNLIDRISGNTYFDKHRYPDDLILIPKELTKDLNDCFLSKRDPYRRNKLTSRFDKRDFLTCLVCCCEEDERKRELYTKILHNLKSLDYWVDLRNRIIHLGEGFSWETMKNSLERDKKENELFSADACSPNDILNCLSRTHNLMMDFLGQQRSPYVGPGKPYYLYSDIVSWIKEKWDMQKK